MWNADITTAQTGSRQSAAARFVEQRPGVPTALTFSVDYVNPDDPSAKPPAVRTVVETLARGARFDTSVPAQCAASDAQLVLQGESACPPGSKVGTGFIRIDTGFPEPNRFLNEDVTFLNNTNQLIFLTTDRASGARFVARASVTGGQLTSSAPPLPGTPPDGGAIDIVQTRLDSISRIVAGEIHGYITTPPQCPPSHAWVNSLSFTYADGVTQNLESSSPCAGTSRTPPAVRRRDPRPVVTGFTASPPTFRVGLGLPRLTRRVPTGTTFRFRLSEPAVVRLTFARALPGRRVGRRCMPPTSARRRRPGCRRFVDRRPVVALSGRQGPNRVRFAGRLSQTRTLAAGRYRVTLIATDRGGQRSVPRRIALTVLAKG
jgi:hypothetical protein